MSNDVLVDDVLHVDLDHLTTAEIEEIEERTGQAIDSLAEKGAKKGTMLRALGFVLRKRDDPTFTWEDAGRLKVQLSGETTVPPIAAAG